MYGHLKVFPRIVRLCEAPWILLAAKISLYAEGSPAADPWSEADVVNLAVVAFCLLHALHVEAGLCRSDEEEQDVSTTELMRQLEHLGADMETKCRICLVAKADAMWEDCGHAVWCMSCHQDSKRKGRSGNCPFCQKGKTVRRIRFV